MTKARRAQPRPTRVVVPIIVVVAALAVAGVVWQLRADTPTATPDPASSASVSPGGDSASATPTGEGSSDDPSSAAPTSSATSAEAAAALEDCQDKVAAGEDVIKAASKGVGHWSEHVQAQTDEFDGRISETKMQTIFARTRLAGPDDLSRYDDATRAWDEATGSCANLDDASSADNSQLAFCVQRITAMTPVMTAGSDAMDDWKSHIEDMQHSRMVHVDDAEQIWLDAWKAAPQHIKAYDKAVDAFADAPDC